MRGAAWRGLVLLAATHGVAHVDRNLFAVVAPALRTRFDLSDTELGLLLGPAFGLAFVAGSLVVGPWIDQARRWRLIGAGLLVWTAASALVAAVDSAPALFAARAAVALGQAVLAPAALSLLLQGPDDGSAGRRIGVFASGASIGRSVALLTGGALLAALPTLTLGAAEPATAWRWLFVVTALPNLGLAALLLARREPPAPAPRAPDAPVLHLWSASDGLLRPAALAVASCCILLTQSLGQWGPSLFARAGSLSAGYAAALAGAVVVVAAPAGAWAGGALVDRERGVGRTPYRGLAVLLLAAALSGVGLGVSRELPALIVSLFATTLAVSAAAVAILAAWQERTPPAVRGSATALYFAVVTAVGLGLGPPLVGIVSDLTTRGGNGLQGALALVIVGVAAVAGGVSLLLAKASAAGAVPR